MAGIQEAFRKAALAAMKGAGNVKEDVVYRSKNKASSTYNPTTDTITDEYVDYPMEMMISGYNVEEQKASGALAPKMRDQIIRKTEDATLEDTVKWEVVGRHIDPASALWTLQLRKP
jgi:hypothetical protein